MEDLIAKYSNEYALLDSGLGQKLEVIAGIKVVRPSPQSIWEPLQGDKNWKSATSICTRTKDGGGFWDHQTRPPEPLLFKQSIENKNFEFEMKFTSFGHCGVFFEQLPIWQKIAINTIELNKKKPAPLFLNLFGYTGVASIVASNFGANVYHVDSAKSVLNWGRNSEKLNPSKNPIHWIHDDVIKFLKYAKKKGLVFNGILADPPSWGHGANKEKWEFEKNISELMSLIFDVIDKHHFYFILSSHTHGVQHQSLKNLLRPLEAKTVFSGDLGIQHKNDPRILPAGIYCEAKNI